MNLSAEIGLIDGWEHSLEQIFSQEEIQRLKTLRAEAAARAKEGNDASRKRKATSSHDDGDAASVDSSLLMTSLASSRDTSEEVNPDMIVGYVKRSKPNREAILESIRQGREDRPRYGAPREKSGGTTNAEKAKHQPFMMVKHSKRVKQKQYEKMSIKQKKRTNHIKELKAKAKKVQKMMKKKN